MGPFRHFIVRTRPVEQVTIDPFTIINTQSLAALPHQKQITHI